MELVFKEISDSTIQVGEGGLLPAVGIIGTRTTY